MNYISTASHTSSVRKYRCPVEKCTARFSSQTTLLVHTKYFHRNSEVKENSYLKCGSMDFYCKEEECFSKHGKSKLFKSYSCLKQHYMATHACKKFECEKCGKKFSELRKKYQHKLNCGIKIFCSCGIAYHGKRGLLSHLKLKNHVLPESAKNLFITKQKSAVYKRCQKKSENKFLSTTSSLIPILPKGNLMADTIYLTSVPSATPSNLPGPLILPKVSCSNKCTTSTVKQSKFSQLRPKERIVIDIYGPARARPATNVSVATVVDRKSSHDINNEQQADSLSSAMISAGINYGGCTADQNMLSKVSQTDNLLAQDFSCQTDDFLSWLDIESARCTRDHSVTNICTQTIKPSDVSHVSDIEHPSDPSASARTVVQHETQTDDDWIFALLQDTTPVHTIGSESQNQAFPSHVNMNHNNNHSHTNFTTVLPEYSCAMQAQTSAVDSVSHVTTQTLHCELGGSDLTDNFLSYLMSDGQTQTGMCKVCEIAGSQAGCDCDGIVRFLNMETQTEE